MKLIPISPNVLVNPESISCVEQRDVQGTSVTYVWVGDRDYVLTYKIEDFYKNLDDGEVKQSFAG